LKREMGWEIEMGLISGDRFGEGDGLGKMCWWREMDFGRGWIVEEEGLGEGDGFGMEMGR